MVSLPRTLRGGVGFYYVVLGCAVTTLYFIFMSHLRSTTKAVNVKNANYENPSRRKCEYEKACREWKLALDQDKLMDKHVANDGKIVPIFEGKSSGDEFELRFNCDNMYKEKHVAQRGQYYVLYNFVRADQEFGCTESITLSAPGDFRFLDNVVPLLERWQGPISLALYAPGDDFFTTLQAIAFLRNCEADLVRKLVTFHIFFDQEHTPKHNGPTILNSYQDTYDCFIAPPWQTVQDENMYRTKHQLLYPINLGRNAAKLAAQTYFIFPNDIELYPTRDFIPLFLKFAKANLNLFEPESRNVFVLPIFEIWASQTVPENKTELQNMLRKRTALIFHQKICIVCHRVIDSEKWVKATETKGLGVFSVGKRIGRHMVWEPFFVCTQKEPLWDERMSWEGQNNKMVQAYTMCLIDYNFHVLDNAFLVHKPGVKKKKVQLEKFGTLVSDTKKLIRKVAVELQELYGYNSNCSINYKPVTQKPKTSPAIQKKT